MHDLSTLSLWHATMPTDEWTTPRPPARGDIEADVVVVGAGYTGLWTAYYLLQRDPSLKVVLLEAEAVGFGASGRNGGWCSALLPMSLDSIAAQHSHEAATRMQAAMHATVDEVARVVAVEGIDCDLAHGGYVSLARNAAQLGRAAEHVQHLQSFGFDDGDYRMVDAAEASRLCGATSVVGAAFTPHCAAIHPAKLVRGLARVVEQSGATIHERSAAIEIAPHLVRTNDAAVHARVVVRATEAFTAAQPGMRRTTAPIYSLMIATEPLPAEFWASVGLHDRPTFADGRHMVIYGQRTADDRLAFGGRGAWYHWGSRMSPAYDRNDRVHSAIHATLRDLFPALGDAEVTHRWGGAVAAARDWWCQAGYDATTGSAHAGNYVGDGVGTTNFAGRTLADLITGTESDLTQMPWVGHRSRRWEPEPFRYLGINSLMVLPLGADRREAKHGTRSLWRERALARLTGGTG